MALEHTVEKDLSLGRGAMSDQFVVANPPNPTHHVSRNVFRK